MSLLRRLVPLLPRRLREHLVRSQLEIDWDVLRDVRVKVATTVDEHERAAQLLQEAYVRRGIAADHPSGMRVTAHGILPSTTVFVAKLGEDVIGTLSLIVDAPLRLPMDKIYGTELDALRDEGRRIAEVGALCVANGKRRVGISFLLNKLMWLCAAQMGIQDLVIAVHPSAACIYEATLRFVRIGPVRTYPGLTAQAKAIALRLDLETAEATLRREFGHRAANERNPYYLYVERKDAQIVLPDAQVLDGRLALVRESSAVRLGLLRPECLRGLPPSERRVLRTLVPRLSAELPSVQLSAIEDGASS